MEQDKNKYFVHHGTLQACITRWGDATIPLDTIYFGLPEYDRHIPILSDHRREVGQMVCDKLNAGEITREEAVEILSKVW